MKIHFVHVSGTRMIEQGIDTLSRGNIWEGIMLSQDMLSFIPLHKGEIKSSPNLFGWLRAWWRVEYITLLNPEHWYTEGHDVNCYTQNTDIMDIPCIKSGVFL